MISSALLGLFLLTPGDERARILDLEQLPHEKREVELAERRAELLESLEQRLPDGWKATEGEGVVVFAQKRSKFARDVVEEIEQTLSALDGLWPRFGRHRHVRTLVVYVAEDNERKRRLQDMMRLAPRFDGVLWTFEAPNSSGLNNKRARGLRGSPPTKSSELLRLQTEATRHWFLERDRHLLWSLPRWLELACLVSTRKVEQAGRRWRLESSWNAEYQQEAKRGNLLPPQETWQIGESPDYKTEGSAAAKAYWNSRAWLYYFQFGPGAKKERHRLPWERYLQSLEEQVQSEARSFPLPSATEHSLESKALEKEREHWDSLRTAFAAKAAEQAFADCSEKDLKELHRAFVKFVEDGS